MGARGNPQIEERLTRVEEGAGFTERAVEQLSGEIAELNRRLAAMGKRVAALEEKLRRAEMGEEEERGGGE